MIMLLIVKMPVIRKLSDNVTLSPNTNHATVCHNIMAHMNLMPVPTTVSITDMRLVCIFRGTGSLLIHLYLFL